MLRCSGWHAQGQHSLFYQICRIATMAFCHRKEKITACIWDPCIISHEAIWLGVTSSGISADSWLKSFPLPEWSIIKTLNRRLHHGLHRDWGAGSEGQAGLKPCLDAPTFMVKKTVFAVFSGNHPYMFKGSCGNLANMIDVHQAHRFGRNATLILHFSSIQWKDCWAKSHKLSAISILGDLPFLMRWWRLIPIFWHKDLVNNDRALLIEWYNIEWSNNPNSSQII